MTYHFGGLGTSDCELEISIFLPVAEEERELGKEAIVGFSGGGDGLWAGVATQFAFLLFGSADELLPVGKLAWVFELRLCVSFGKAEEGWNSEPTTCALRLCSSLSSEKLKSAMSVRLQAQVALNVKAAAVGRSRQSRQERAVE